VGAVWRVVERLGRRRPGRLSGDTAKAEVAKACLAAGGQIINDVTALTGDPSMPESARESRAGVILMHMQGTPQTMQMAPTYDDVVRDILQFFEARLQALTDFGIGRTQVALDP